MKALFYNITFFLGFAILANSEDFSVDPRTLIYTVKEGDSTGELLLSRGLRPLWGKNGYVQKLIKLNSKLVSLKGNLILPGDEIILPLPAKRSVASIVAMPTQEKFQPFGNLSIRPKLSFSMIKATEVADGASSNIYSNPAYGAIFTWGQSWSKDLKTSYFFDIEKRTYQAPPNRTFLKNNMTLINVGVSGNYRLTKRLSLNSEVTYGEELFLNAPNTRTLTLDKAAGPKGRLGVGVTFIDLSPFKVTGGLGANTIIGRKVKDYNSKSSLGYYGNLELTQTYKDKTFMASIEYQVQDKDTTNFKQIHTDLQFSIGILWNFGDEK